MTLFLYLNCNMLVLILVPYFLILLVWYISLSLSLCFFFVFCLCPFLAVLTPLYTYTVLKSCCTCSSGFEWYLSVTLLVQILSEKERHKEFGINKDRDKDHKATCACLPFHQSLSRSFISKFTCINNNLQFAWAFPVSCPVASKASTI